MFDLLELYIKKEDLGARSHIRCRGKNLRTLSMEIVEEIIQKGDKISHICKRISKKLNLNKDTPLKMFRGINSWFTLAILKELLNEWKIKCNKTEKELLIVKKKVVNAIEFLSCGSSKKIYMNAVKENSEILSYIAGAHHADGNLFKEFDKKGTHYKFQIIDHYRKNLESFKEKFKELFGSNLIIKKSKHNAWLISTRNKIFARYLEIFFSFPAGKKKYFNLSKIIKNSNLKIQKSYLKGFISFDGSVETDKTISLGIANEILIKEFNSILKKLNYRVKKSIKSGFYHLKTPILKNNEIKKWMNLFEEDTEKWLKLKGFISKNKVQVKSYEKAAYILNLHYPYQNSSKIKISDISNALKELKICDKYQLANKSNVAVSTLYRYLHILEKAKILIKKNNVGRYPNKIYFHYNSNVKEWRLPNYLL